MVREPHHDINMVITSISQQKRNTDNVNLFIDNEFFCSISKNQLIELDLHKEKEITEDEKEIILKSSERNKIKEKLNRFLSLRPRSTKEVRDYLLYKRKIEKEEAEAIVDEYLHKNFLNDLKFAKWFVEQRINSGKYGSQKIKADLIKKGISKEHIKNAIEEKVDIEEEEKILYDLIEKLERKIKEEDPMKKKEKVARRLMSKGFRYTEITSILNGR